MKPVHSALLIIGGLSVYLTGGMVFRDTAPEQISKSMAQSTFAVRAETMTAQPFSRIVTLRGRTAALRAVELKAELEGPVIRTPVEPGSFVKAGTLLCELEKSARTARLSEAEAQLMQRQLEFEAAQSLFDKNVRTSSQLAAARASLKAASANVAQQKRNLEAASIQAPFDGFVDRRPADVGSFLQKGQICAVLVQRDPMIAVAEISQDYVNLVPVDSTATLSIAGVGETTGSLRHIAAIANDQTRAFRLEVSVANPDGIIRDGQTSIINLSLGSVNAHLIPASALILGPEGNLGIRAVNERNIVEFHSVDVLEDTTDGIWVGGLPDKVDLITVGQAFVARGEKVRPVRDSR